MATNNFTLSTDTGRPQSGSVERTRYEHRLYTRVAATIISAIALAFLIPSVVAQPDPDRNYDYGYYDNGRFRGWISPEGYTFISISILWNAAEFTVLSRRGRKNRFYPSGIHPGAHVAIDLILWMGFLAAGLTKVLIDLYMPLGVASGAILLIAAAPHFALFVWACIDVDRLKVHREAKRITAMAMEMQAGNGAAAGTQFTVPEGMALVPIETLAKLEKAATANSESAAPAYTATPKTNED